MLKALCFLVLVIKPLMVYGLIGQCEVFIPHNSTNVSEVDYDYLFVEDDSSSALCFRVPKYIKGFPPGYPKKITEIKVRMYIYELYNLNVLEYTFSILADIKLIWKDPRVGLKPSIEHK